jgi:hypothetical protein
MGTVSHVDSVGSAPYSMVRGREVLPKLHA